MRSRTLHQTLTPWGAALVFVAVACDGRAPAPDAAAPDAAAPIEMREPEDVPLIDQLHWRPYSAALDPLPSHQPPQVQCEPPGWHLELDRLEINTGECNYALLEHPALLDVSEGSEITIALWHFDLTAPEPAHAHIAVFFGDDLQWDLTLDIPQPGDMHRFTFHATRALAAGDPIRLHLHNHGRNSWILASVQVQRSQFAPK